MYDKIGKSQRILIKLDPDVPEYFRKNTTKFR